MLCDAVMPSLGGPWLIGAPQSTAIRLKPKGCAGLKEDEANPEEDAANNKALQSVSHGATNTAIWRLLDGPGATPEVAARTPVANRTAAGRADFVLQVTPPAPLCIMKTSKLSVLWCTLVRYSHAQE